MLGRVSQWRWFTVSPTFSTTRSRQPSAGFSSSAPQGSLHFRTVVVWFLRDMLRNCLWGSHRALRAGAVGVTTLNLGLLHECKEVRKQIAVSTRVSSVNGLSLREFVVIVFPAQSRVYELAQSAFSTATWSLSCTSGATQMDRAVSPPFQCRLSHLIDVAAQVADKLDADWRQLHRAPINITRAFG